MLNGFQKPPGFMVVAKVSNVLLSVGAVRNVTNDQEAEWEVYFITEAYKANPIKTQTNVSYIAIDVMVYELYSLSKEEIEIVENS